MAVVFSLFARTNRTCDWTNEELAELYRVEHALGQANIALEVERGVTDEGDPWFVFCRHDGEVLVHVARYDGLYHLFSPALPKALVGKSFSELTRSFVAKVPAKEDTSPSSKIVQHPSALLSMLVVTIFFSIDHLTGHGGRADAAPLVPALVPAAAGSNGAIQAVVSNMLASVGNAEVESVLESAFLAAQAAVLFIVHAAALDALTPSAAVAAPEMAGAALTDIAPIQVTASTAPENLSVLAAFSSGGEPALAIAAKSVGVTTEGAASLATASVTAPAAIAAAPALAAMTAPAPTPEIFPVVLQTQSAVPPASEMVVLASAAGGQVNLAGDGSVHVVELFGNGSVTLSGLCGDGSQTIEALGGGAETLRLEFASGANSLKQTVEIEGGSAVTLQSVSTQEKAAGATVNLTVDSAGNHSNTLNISNAAVQGVTLNLKIIGSQDLTLQESATVLNGSSLDASGLHAQLTVGVDLSGSASPTTLVGASDFVVNNNDIVALVNVPDNASIQVATNLDSVLTQFAGASSSESLTLNLQSAAQTAAPVSVSLVNVSGAASLNLNSGGGSVVNTIGVVIDSSLQNLQIHGSGSLSIGAIDGVTSADSQNITIDASQLSGNLSIDVSGIPDVANGGRQITIVGGQGNNVLTNSNATETTTFVAGGGQDTFNVAKGAQSVTINGLHAGDAIVVGRGAASDTIVDATHLAGQTSAYLNSLSLPQAAATAASAAGASGAHQAVLFDYHNSLYVFIDAAGSHVFNASADALIQIVGMSKAVDLAHVFFSA